MAKKGVIENQKVIAIVIEAEAEAETETEDGSPYPNDSRILIFR